MNCVDSLRGCGHDDCGYSTGNGEVHFIANNEIDSEVDGDGDYTTLTIDDNDVDNSTTEESKYLHTTDRVKVVLIMQTIILTLWR